jgi:O-antigen/teichoic acid export membrane protein
VVFSTALIVRSGGILLALSLAAFVLPGWIHGAPDIVLAWTFAYLAVAAWLAFALMRSKKSANAPDRPAMVEGLKYGGPLLIAILIAQLLQYADRFLVAGQIGYAEAGRYFIHAKVAGMLALVAMPIQLWWPVARFEHRKDIDGGEAFFARTSLIGVGAFSLALIALAAIAPFVFRWFAPSFAMDALLLFLLLGAFYVQISAIFFNVGLLDAGNTHVNVVVWLATACVQLSTQILLVPRLGGPGAAIGVFAGALCALTLQFSLSQRRRYVRFPLGQLLALAIAAFASAFIILLQIA